jgi:molecular chaperone GrpE
MDAAPDGSGQGRTEPRAEREHPTPADAEQEIARLEQELKQAKDQYLRTLAEVDNTKKRLQREKDEFARYAAEKVLRELLPVLDSLDQALAAIDQQPGGESVVRGVHLIHHQLLSLLKREGVVKIPTVGEPFDPHHHEAVGHLEPQNGQAEETVVEEIQAGYAMHGQVLRPAMVKVAKRATEEKKE